MSYYRDTFPTETITPKLHMLENHVVPFIKKWGLGLGLYSEQGGESIHAEFNKLRRQYHSVTPANRRVLLTLKQHHVNSHPKPKSMKVVPKKRKINATEE